MVSHRILFTAALAALGGCSGRSASGPMVEVCSEIGAVDRLTITVLDAHGALLVDRPVPESGGPPTLPGRIRLDAGTRDQAVRVFATGWRKQQPVGFGRATLQLPAGGAKLCLTAFPPDRDGDGIPDDVDGCPDIPDPQQQDVNGDGVTDICAYLYEDAGTTDAGARDDGTTSARPDAPPPGIEAGAPPPDVLPPIVSPDLGLGPCPVGTACDDGDPCTTGDSCVAGGACRGSTAPNGTACGAVPAKRCCGGQCVNIAADPNHCGGCGLRCDPGRTCQGVSLTTLCDVRPQQTSGRCICGYGDNSQCPSGQICRTETPEKNRCSPKEKGHCAAGQSVRWLTGCPNYCYY